MKLFLICILFISSYAFSTNANSASLLSEPEIFHRCYMKMVRNVISRTDTNSQGYKLLDRVQKKEITGAQACIQLFESAQFNPDNGTTVTPDSSESRAIIKNFHNLHHSWFTSKRIDIDNGFISATMIVRDNDEPALYFTRALFQSDQKAGDILRGTDTLRSIRKLPNNFASNWDAKTVTLLNETFHPTGMKIPILSVIDNVTTIIGIPVAPTDLVPYGDLIGVKSVSSFPIGTTNRIAMETNAGTAGSFSTEFVNHVRPQTFNVDLFQNLGGGILGSQIFILKNTNLTTNQIAGGTTNEKDRIIARRLAARIFTDLLCHQLPTLSDSDPGVETIPNSNFTFHLSKSCMGCHASMDPLAYTFRNLIVYGSARNDSATSTDAQKQAGSPIFGVLKFTPKDSSQYFALKNPTGTLRYRNHDGQLTSGTTVNSLAEIGENLASDVDFYQCMAKRYYNFFTGIDVNLTTRNVFEDTSTMKYHRDVVKQIALELKEDPNQRVKEVIRKILSSEAFRSRSYLGMEP